MTLADIALSKKYPKNSSNGWDAIKGIFKQRMQ